MPRDLLAHLDEPAGRDLLAEVEATPPAPERSMGEQALRGLGRTARAGIEGVTAIPGMFANAPAALYNKIADFMSPPEPSGERGFRFPYQTRFGGAIADALGLPRPENAQERIAGDVAGAMAGGGALAKGGEVLAKAASPITARIGEVLAANQGAQIVASGTGTGAASATREAGGGEGAQLAANLAASVAVPAAAQVWPKGAAIRPREAALLAEADRRDVPLSYTDVTGKGKRLDTALEQVPLVGTAGFRERGAERVTAAAHAVVDEAKGTLGGINYRGLDRLRDAAAAGDKGAKKIVEQIENSGDDWQRIMQSSGQLKAWRARQSAEALYNRVEGLASGRGDVDMQHTLRALDDAIATEGRSKLPNDALKNTLDHIRKSVEGSADNGFSAVRQLRSDLGDVISSYYKGANAIVGGKGVDKLQAVRSAVERDMEAFAMNSGGDLSRAWKRADQFYRSQVVPFKDAGLARALKSDMPDEIYSQFVKVSRAGAGEDRAEKFYQALDQRGRAAVRYGMVANALDDSTIPGKTTISPARFARSLEGIEKATGVFFRGDAKVELDGFTNLMRHAERFGQYAENPPTGQRIIPWLVAGGVAFEPGTALGALGGAGVLRLMLTNAQGRNLLLRASSLEPGSPAMSKVSDDLARQLPRLAADAAKTRDSR